MTLAQWVLAAAPFLQRDVTPVRSIPHCKTPVLTGDAQSDSYRFICGLACLSVCCRTDSPAAHVFFPPAICQQSRTAALQYSHGGRPWPEKLATTEYLSV
jgi:hypothetical protein